MSIDIPSPMQEALLELGCCGCGCPQNTYAEIHKMLLFYSQDIMTRKAPESWGVENVSNNPFVQYMAYILDNEEVIEHGTRIDFGWLTAKGKELLKYPEWFAVYNYEWDDVPDNIFYVEEAEEETE